MFVVIEASQGKDTRLFVVADNGPRRFVAPQSFREAVSECDASSHPLDGLQPRQFAETIGKWRFDPQATSNVKRRRFGSPWAKRMARGRSPLKRSWFGRVRCFLLR